MPHAGYSGTAYRREDRDHILAAAERILHGLEFDAIAVRGVSGLLMGPLIAHVLNKQIIVVRKPQEIQNSVSHSEMLVECLYDYSDEFRYVFVDDTSCSGRTYRAVMSGIKDNYFRAAHIGSFYYNGSPVYRPADGSQSIY